MAVEPPSHWWMMVDLSRSEKMHDMKATSVSTVQSKSMLNKMTKARMRLGAPVPKWCQISSQPATSRPLE